VDAVVRHLGLEFEPTCLLFRNETCGESIDFGELLLWCQSVGADGRHAGIHLSDFSFLAAIRFSLLYTLARDPREISLAEIIRTLDGPFAPTPCSRTRDPIQCEGCADMETCVVRPFMREVRDAMAEVLEKKSLADLVEEMRHGKEPAVPMYYI
jgi:hypothetical protein